MQSLTILKNLRLMGDKGTGRTQRWRGMGLLSEVPPAPHLAANHSPILNTESSARKGRPYLQNPLITEEEPGVSFPKHLETFKTKSRAAATASEALGGPGRALLGERRWKNPGLLR